MEGLSTVELAYVLSDQHVAGSVVVISDGEDRAEQLERDLRAFGALEPVLFPGEEPTPLDDESPDHRFASARNAVRARIVLGARPQVIVATASAVQGTWMPTTDFLTWCATWQIEEEVPRDEMLAHLVCCGYQRVNMVEDPGTFAVRGSVVDVFAPDGHRPVRLDLFGDSITSIKTFDPTSQRTFDALEQIVVYPIREVVFDDATVHRAKARLGSIAQSDVTVPSLRLRALLEEIDQRHYFYGIEGLTPAFYEHTEPVIDALVSADTLVVLDHCNEVEDLWSNRWARAHALREQKIQSHEMVLPIEDYLLAPENLARAFADTAVLRHVTLADDSMDQPQDLGFTRWTDLARELKARREDASRGEILDPVVDTLKACFEKGYEVFLACGHRGSAERLQELLRARKIDLPLQSTFPTEPWGMAPSVRQKAPRRCITVAAFSEGFEHPDRKVALLTDTEIFGTIRRGRITRRRSPSNGLNTLKGLAEGDLIIHVDHGIGKYLGLLRLILNGVDGDYVHLEYAGGDKLYVPIYRLNLLQRQSDPGARLDKLGGNRWLKAKQRVKDAVLELAHHLLALQARRAALPGYRLPEPDEHFRSFEATFPYEETPDQRKAINDVLDDLVKDTPMDRLVCGDVGFGKTEVAIRGAFLAIQGGRQVAVLVPTTVLAEQHGETFRERLGGEAVNVEVLSRFRPPKEIRSILQRVEQGSVDVLVGTHRLLSHDVHFKSLGLLVVDEEQRFGVKHKERIKELRSRVHVLTLSATPIPRTLHMSMVGLRDLSIIQTAPAQRVSIKTHVTRFDEDLIQDVIRREIHRGGQVFVVHNRVQSIGAFAELIERLVPEAKVVVAHGQMSGTQLEKVMVGFVQRKYNVLVSTAIIESGIDIPSANTMIVNRADMFGLAQLYQLRGRIGRGRDRAYAYLLLPRSQRITKEASDRLSVLKRFSELGSGFQIASHDLDIRGAGDLLGAEQSGHIAAVGFELYTELLSEAVEQAKGEHAQGEGAMHTYEPEIKLPVPAVIPEAYVPQPMQRLAYYQRMSQAATDEAVHEVCAEIEDVYGHAPEELHYLREVMIIRRRLKVLKVSQLSAAVNGGAVRIGVSFLPDATVDRARLALRIQQEPNHFKLLPSGRLAITVPAADDLSEIPFLRCVRSEIADL